jgi:hypothetical protein
LPWSQRSNTLVGQIRTLERQIATAVSEHPDGPIFLSLFKHPTSFITAAELLAEIGDCRARYPTRDSLAADAGQAAVAIESGKRKTACFRRGCNKRLRSSFCMLADSTRKWHPLAADHYANARARGHDHPRAIRALQAHCTVTIPDPSEPHPDLAATQRMLAITVTETAARRAEHETLDSKPTPATAHRG